MTCADIVLQSGCKMNYYQMLPTDEDVLSPLGLPDAGTTTSSIIYANWAHLPEWIKEVLGDNWYIIAKSGYVGVTEASTDACWWLERKGAKTSTSTMISINVHVASQLDADGVLDMAASKQAARRCLAGIITSTSRDIKDVWTRGGLDEFGECSVQDLDGSRFVLVAGQTVLDIRDRGMDLTAEVFEGYARKLLEHTVRRDSPLPLTAPIIKRGPLLSLSDKYDLESRPKNIQIRSVVPRFSLWFELRGPIAVADATVEGSADDISLESRVVEEDVRVRFTFAVATPGHHLVEVHAHFADSETMVLTSQMFEVELLYTRRM
ncbi:uncharacterized protein EV420DRAFT_1132974 [Desarmillaria tabescens]|uniref:Uncharacterized protein n=1 Tax=Armillaria tabescens TaxID=1929756 RepID=A0AA39JH27_ARMTA|nr:uncharacterized protein EV420DRAFT_1132974 [Desarmillaria tabescens]KAK0440383.1 hypothetical protein EV420DRAFT_1132974 [Desarmillaria tabescens]